MDKQQMLERIYEVIADKMLIFWCKVESPSEDNAPWIYINDCKVYWLDIERVHTEKDSELKIIWHPVMIGDVLDWLSKNHKNYYDTQMIILRERSYYTKPINDQSDECIKFVFDLLPKE